MLAGAYSKTYKQIEKQQVEHLKQMMYNEEDDAIAKAKKLQQETNRRRKAQAVKRKLEAQREEKRRQNILAKRREEQREATEKFQRSHVSSRPSSKNSNSSGKRSPKFSHRTLEDTLKLVRGSSARHSAKHHTSPYSTPLIDPLNRPYVNKYSGTYQSTDKKNDNNASHLHNNSLRNLSNSRNLFEQQLEQHQQLLVDQQQRTLNEFNDAIKNEIDRDQRDQGLEFESNGQNLPHSDSLSSVDSLENSDDSLSYDINNGNNQQNDKNQEYFNRNDTNGYHGYNKNDNGQHSANAVPPHRNCHSIQQQLEQDKRDISQNDQIYYQNNGKIDSYDVNGTSNLNDASATNPKDRPKVQVRAWATPSPVDASHRQQPEQHSQRMMTNANVYTQRNTATNITTTTAYVRGTSSTGQQYAQSNNNTNGDVGSLVNGTQPHPQVAFVKSQNENNRPQSGKNMEFLETVTNGYGCEREENDINNERLKDPPPSRVPRPVTVVKKVIPSKQIATPSPTTTTYTNSNQVITSAKTTSTPVSKPVVLSVSNVNNQENEQSSANNDVPKLQLNAGGKLSILPDKPVMPVTRTASQPKQTRGQKVSSPRHEPVKKSKDDSELETISKAKLEEMESGAVKGILKRPVTSTKIPAAGTIKRAGSTGSMNIKDSLEVTKSHMNTDKFKKPKKKSVRFADVRYSDEVEEETEEDDDKLFTKRISVQITPKKRPVSAKPNMQTLETETIPKSYGRASSASDKLAAQKHKSTIRPQAAAHIITHNPPAVNKEVNQPEKKVTVINNNFMSKVPSLLKNMTSQIQPVSTEVTMYTVPGARLNYAVASTVTNPQKQEIFQNGYHQQPTISNTTPGQGVTNGLYQETPVYDENGLRIDRTPTDDEINFLWDKVRNCLQRNPAPANSPVSDTAKPPFFDQSAPRQAAPVAHTYIDGTALGQIAQQARVTNYGNQSTTNGRKSADPNGYQRRLLLQRQKQQNPNSLNKNGNQQRQIITYHGPMSSHAEPQQGNNQYQPRQDTGDSMTAFLMAEQLAQQSMSESQMNHTLNEVQSKPISSTRPAANVPSALSIEERRLLESLDKLNEQLKITEYPGPLPQQAPPPQPVQPSTPQHYVHKSPSKDACTPSKVGKQPLSSTSYTMYNLNSNTGGFRGHQPFTHHRRNSGVHRKLSPHSPTLQNFRFS